MRVPRKIQVEECSQCKKPCTTNVWSLTHRKLSGKRRGKTENSVFCSQTCIIEHFEIQERMLEKLHQLLQKEKAELHKRVCPACVRRFVELD